MNCPEKFVNGRIRYFHCFSIKIVLLLVFAFATNIGVANSKLQQKEISVSVQNAPLSDVLKQIQKQCDYRLLYSNELLNATKPITVDVRSSIIENVLNECLKSNGLDYTITNKTILIKKRENALSQYRELIEANGVVYNEKGETLPGVTIIIKETKLGVTTNPDGTFSIQVPVGNILIFSFVGMKTKEVVVKDSKPMKVTMVVDDVEMDEVVVTGFNNIKASSYTGNAISVQKEELLKASKTNVIKALQTFDPSLRIKQNNAYGSDPNALPELYIRGESGIGVKELDDNQISKSNLKNNPNLPTFIMDGFEVSVNKLYDLDPNRIESVTILKDAAATALYGSRAANGVIVITTIMPKEGTLNVDYSFVGSLTAPDLSGYNLANAAEKLEVERLAGCYEYNADRNNLQYDKYAMELEYNKKLYNVKRGVDTYWLSQPLRTVFNHKHSLYVNGGSSTLRFGVDMQYTKQNGVMKGSSRDRVGAGFYLQYILKNFTIKNYVSYASTISNESPYGSFKNYAEQLPYDVIYDENGKVLEELTTWSDASIFGGRVNPLYEPSLKNKNRSVSDELIDNLSLNWYIIPGVLLKGQLSVTKIMGNSKNFLDPASRNNSNRLSLTNLSSGRLDISDNNSLSLDANVTLSYNKSIGDHVINSLIGYNVITSKDVSSASAYTGFPSGDLSSPNYAQKMDGKVSYEDSRRRLLGIIASLNYTFKDTYLLDASLRYDGSSAFGADKRFAPFWSAGVGINLHKYDFIKNISVIDRLKVRGSYGQIGKVNFPPYAARTTYRAATDEWYKTGYGVSLMALGNTNLKWETTNTWDFGFETSLFKNRLFFKASYYTKKTVDLINDVTIPSHTGFTTYRDNIGEVRNKGVEFDLRVSAIRTDDMSLYITANLAHNENKILKISESLKQYNSKVEQQFNDYDATKPFLQYREGGSLNSIYGVKSLGINPADGNEIFVRPNGETTAIWRAADQVVLGNSNPDIQGSFSLNYTYKQFSLYASFMYEYGAQIYNQTLVDKVENVNVYTTNVDKRVLKDRWQKPGDIAKYKSILVGRNSTNVTQPTSRFIQDNNVLELTSLELGYDFSKDLVKKMKLTMLRLTFGMNDVFHLSSVKQERGTQYPFARTFDFSLKASF